jgi:hypothetical protein
MITSRSGAQFEILVDGKPRSYRDIKAVAIETAEFLKGIVSKRKEFASYAVQYLYTIK